LEGSKVAYSADNCRTVGGNHQFRLTQQAVRTPFDAGDGFDRLHVGHQLKKYEPEHLGGREEGDPLAHSKLGAPFKKGLNGDEAVPWHRRYDPVEALDSYVLNIASWAGIAVSPGPWWVSDWHFSGGRYTHPDRQVALIDDLPPETEQRQEAAIVSLFRETDADSAGEAIVEELARTDGGTSVDDVESATDWSRSTTTGISRSSTRSCGSTTAPSSS
jgi:hypothetical protein